MQKYRLESIEFYYRVHLYAVPGYLSEMCSRDIEQKNTRLNRQFFPVVENRFQQHELRETLNTSTISFKR